MHIRILPKVPSSSFLWQLTPLLLSLFCYVLVNGDIRLTLLKIGSFLFYFLVSSCWYVLKKMRELFIVLAIFAESSDSSVLHIVI